MFWLQRLKQDEQDATWAISYADMMSLLMALFVMLAAMGELRAGTRFSLVRDAVRGAFGFSVAPERTPPAWSRPLSLPEQLARAGLIGPEGPPAPVQDESLRCCDVTHEADGLVIRIAGGAAFDGHSAGLRPEGQAAIERLARFLDKGTARLEIRCHDSDGPSSDTSLYRDGLDLSYARARNVVDAFTRAGIRRERFFVTAWGDQDPLVATASGGSSAAANRRIEIVVHAAQALERNEQFAEKGQQSNAQ